MTNDLRVKVSRGIFTWHVHVIRRFADGKESIQMVSTAETREKARYQGKQMREYYASLLKEQG